MLAEHIAAAALVLMLIYVYSKRAAAGFLAWITFALSCVAKIPDFLSGEDYFNTAVFAFATVFFSLLALAVIRRNSEVMQEITTFSALACAVYFPFAFIPVLNTAIIEKTAELSVLLGNTLGFPMMLNGSIIELNGRSVEIILACTAIESMSLFAGATLGIKAEFSRKLKAFLISVPVIYVLNLFRNVFVVASYAYSWFGENSFYIAHNVVSKFLSTLALIAIAYVVFRILPELAELIYALKGEILRGVGLD